MRDFRELGLDRNAFTVGALNECDAREYWRTRTPEERLAALEFLRQVMYDYDPVTDRISRVLEVVKLGER